MGRVYLYIIFLFCTFCVFSCKRYVCPTYSGAFLLGMGHEDFYYKYEEDSLTPKTEGLWAAQDQKWNGKIKKGRIFRGRQALWEGKRRVFWYYKKKKRIFNPVNSNLKDPAVILATIQWPDTMDEEIFVDSVIIDTTDVFDRPYVAEDNLQPAEADSVETDSTDTDGFKWPAGKFDQYFYDIGIRAMLEADSAAQAEADTTEQDTITYVMLERNTWWKLWKPKYIRVPQSSYDSVMAIYSDSNYVSPKEAKRLAKQEEKEAKRLAKEEAKRLKEEEKEQEETLEEAEEGYDDW